MFLASRNESSGLFKKAAGAYLTYKALPFGQKKKQESGLITNLFKGYIAMRIVPKMVKWIGGGALLAYAASYGYSMYAGRKPAPLEGENML